MSVSKYFKEAMKWRLAGGHASEHAAMGVTMVDVNTWPMVTPGLLTTPPTLTAGTNGAASAISGSTLHSVLNPSKFTTLGGPVTRGLVYPNYMGANMGTYPQITSPSPTAVEFTLDTADSIGRFEIYSKGGGQAYRVLLRINGVWLAATQYAQRTLPNDGGLYRDLITLGAAGIYTVRIEFTLGVFFGVIAAASDTVAALKNKKRRYIVVGDSFTEPTIVDTGSSFQHNGWVQQLAYLTGYDMWSAGSGGTGFVATNGGRPKYYDRLVNDVLAFSCDGVILAGGINDPAGSLAAIGTEVKNCIALLKAAGKEVLVISPFYKSGINGYGGTFLNIADVVKQQAAAAGVTYLDLLNYGKVPSFLAPYAGFTTTTTAIYTGGTGLVVADIPGYFKLANINTDQWFIKVSDGVNQYVREVTNIAGSGPYTLTLKAALLSGFAVGSTVSLTGDGYQTGTGRQTATVGDGNSDRYTSSDTTHPTVLGHANIARCVADLWAKAVTK